ncbi:ribosomal protein L4 [Panus rudis PR-1116 ss-1]|nr:ribosomal protein L4 [Panus rudis PR-1116 ss-1]
MLTAIRHALRRPKCQWRALSTVVSEPQVVTADIPPSAANSSGPSTAPKRPLVHLPWNAPTSVSVKAEPVTSPIYLNMSSLIPTEDASVLDEIVELDPFIFDHPIRRDILHLCVVQYLDSLRQGTASTKSRGEVRGSGRKIRPQKGTGEARLGDGQSPMLRGGGVAFGPKPRDFSTDLPRKVIQMGMRVALSARVKEHGLGIVRSLEWPGSKTRGLVERLEELGWQKTLFVTGLSSVPEGLRRASSNIHKVATTTAEELTVYDAVKWPRLVLDIPAVEYFEQTLAKRVAKPSA